MELRRPDLVRVDFACNDPDNGLFAGRVAAIQIYDADPVLELELPTDGPGRRLAIDGNSFRLAGKGFHHQGWREWIGNWCWNGAWMTIDEAARMLGWLRWRRLFAATCGEAVLMEQWRAGPLFGGPHLLRVLAAAGQHQRCHR